MNLTETLHRFGAFVTRHNKAVLLTAGALVALSLYLASGLGIETDMANLLPEGNPAAQSFTAISEDFDSTSSLIVLVSAPDRAQLIQAAERFKQELLTLDIAGTLVNSIHTRTEPSFVQTAGLILQDSNELADSARLFKTDGLLPLIRETNDLIEEGLADNEEDNYRTSEDEYATLALISRFGLFTRALSSALEDDIPPGQSGAELAESFLFGEQYLLDPEEKNLLISVRPAFDIGDRKKLTMLSTTAQTAANTVKTQYPAVGFAFTGDIQNEADEEQAISADLFYPSLLAIALLIVLFWFSFSRKRSILFAVAALAAGIIVDLGIAAVTVKNLNMITSSFGALLVGLGIDFGIHLVSRYDENRQTGQQSDEAATTALATVGAPVLIGAVTTALAFYALLFSGTVAFRQFGLVAGTGILTTLLSSFSVLPALLVCFKEKPVNSGKQKKILQFMLPARIALSARRKSFLILPVAAALTLTLALMLPNNRFEYDMRKIGPQHTPAIATENLVAQRFSVSTWLCMASAKSLSEAASLTAQFEALPMVRSAQSLSDFLPSREEQIKRLPAIREIYSMIHQRQNSRDSIPRQWQSDDIPVLIDEIQRLEWNLIEIGDLASAGLGENSLPVRKRNSLISEILGNERGVVGQEIFQRLIVLLQSQNPADTARQLTLIDQSFKEQLDSRIAILAAIDKPLEIDILPASIRNEYLSEDGTHFLIVIQGSPDLDGNANFVKYVNDLETIDTSVTGSLPLGFHLSWEVIQEAKSSALYIFALVCLLLALSLRSFRSTLSSILAFSCAIIWMFGIYPFFGAFNIVNALALPLIIGIGIDYCVHMIAALREEDINPGSLHKTVKAVTLSALTTIIGFGSLALAGQFKGIADLGTLLSIGISFSYVVAIVIVPAIVGRKRIISKETL